MHYHDDARSGKVSGRQRHRIESHGAAHGLLGWCRHGADLLRRRHGGIERGKPCDDGGSWWRGMVEMDEFRGFSSVQCSEKGEKKQCIVKQTRGQSGGNWSERRWLVGARMIVRKLRSGGLMQQHDFEGS